MPRVNNHGYVERRTICKKSTFRDWYFVKFNNVGHRGVVSMKDIFFPLRYIGKRIRFKVEVIGEKVNKK